jgi:MSHA biogenesis protein MshO
MAIRHIRPLHSDQYGFSLLELILVIVIGGIVASMTTSILTLPIKGYVDSARRATLTASAESALNRMQRDIRRALPNSIRISADSKTLELLHIIDGGRYRAKHTLAGSGDTLDFSIADNGFDVLGNLQNFSNIATGADQVAIYPLNTAGSDPYAGDNIVATGAGSTANHITHPAFQFPLKSPQQRFFIVDTPITYHCDTSAASEKNKVLIRYEDYAIQAAQPIPPATGGAIQANYVGNCVFSYNSGSNTRSGLVTIELTLTDEAGESIRLVHQVHVDNQP